MNIFYKKTLSTALSALSLFIAFSLPRTAFSQTSHSTVANSAVIADVQTPAQKIAEIIKLASSLNNPQLTDMLVSLQKDLGPVVEVRGQSMRGAELAAYALCAQKGYSSTKTEILGMIPKLTYFVVDAKCFGNASENKKLLNQRQ